MLKKKTNKKELKFWLIHCVDVQNLNGPSLTYSVQQFHLSCENKLCIQVIITRNSFLWSRESWQIKIKFHTHIHTVLNWISNKSWHTSTPTRINVPSENKAKKAKTCRFHTEITFAFSEEEESPLDINRWGVMDFKFIIKSLDCNLHYLCKQHFHPIVVTDNMI